jgi:hypothetical protein
MKLFELDSDAQLTQEMIKEFGEEYSVIERIRLNMYGIGNLRLVSADPSLLKFYDSRDHTIKTHFDWTKKGAVVRVRTMERNYALGLKTDEILKIELAKEPDEVFAHPLLYGWVLLKIGISHRIIRWLPLSGLKSARGRVSVKIELAHKEPLIFELKGDTWKDAISTFVTPATKEKVTTIDKGYKLD